MKIFTKLFVSIFYIGYIKFASGTWGSLVAIALLYPFIKFTILPYEVFIAVFIIFFLFLIYVLITFQILQIQKTQNI